MTFSKHAKCIASYGLPVIGPMKFMGLTCFHSVTPVGLLMNFNLLNLYKDYIDNYFTGHGPRFNTGPRAHTLAFLKVLFSLAI